MKILSIIIGNNSGNLLNGPHNDASLMYNLIIDYGQIDNAWLKPYFMTSPSARLTELEACLKKDLYDTILIFFAGHGFPNGVLSFSDNVVSPNQLYSLINSTVKNPVKLFIVLDCCFSGQFPKLTKFGKIIDTHIISGGKDNQLTTESIAEYNTTFFKHHKGNKLSSNSIIVGIFTMNFVLILRKQYLPLLEWKTVINDPVWKDIELNLGQTISIK